LLNGNDEQNHCRELQQDSIEICSMWIYFHKQERADFGLNEVQRNRRAKSFFSEGARGNLFFAKKMVSPQTYKNSFEQQYARRYLGRGAGTETRSPHAGTA
jgi:hypothetical protein